VRIEQRPGRKKGIFHEDGLKPRKVGFVSRPLPASATKPERGASIEMEERDAIIIYTFAAKDALAKL
jgi:hypothetical protein